MSGMSGVLNDLYVRFMVWLGAEPPLGYEHLIGAETSPKKYTMQKGDTLFSVARKFNVHYERIAKANGMEKPEILQPGQTLLIPPANWDPASGPLQQLRAPESAAPPPTPEALPTIETAPPEPLAPTQEPEPPPTVAVAEVAPEVTVEPVAPPPEEIAEVAAPTEEQAIEAEPVVETWTGEEVAPVALEAEQPPTLPEQDLIFRYEVQHGDTLSAIARRYDVTVEQLVEANALADERIFAGQKLIIPGYSPTKPQPTHAVEPQPLPPLTPPIDQYFMYTVTRGDTLHSIANRYGVTAQQIVELNQIEHPDMIRIGQQLMVPSVAAPPETGLEAAVKPPFTPPTFAVVDPTFPPAGPANAVRAFYVSYFALGHPDMRQRVFQLLESTELNAVVIDVKSDEGLISYPTQVPLAHEIGAARPMAKDFDLLMTQLKVQGIYTIARIVTFKDSLLAKHHSEYAVKLSNAIEVLPDQEHLSWNDPFLEPVWDYNIRVALEAAQLGFDEILFSHVRFPGPSQAGSLQFSQEATRETRVAAITSFLSLARGQFEPYGVKVAADTLGYTCWRKDDSLIGQDIERMGQYLDVLCPMLYPSTFGSGIPGYKMAVAYPYEVVSESARRAVGRVTLLGCEVRPWLQDFPDYRFDKRVYGREEIQAQIKGCFDVGCTGFMVWDHRVKYTDGAYAPVRVTV
jgi:LysM repeat protein